MRATDAEIENLPSVEDLESTCRGIIAAYGLFLQKDYATSEEIPSLLQVKERLEQLERYMDNMVSGHRTKR